MTLSLSSGQVSLLKWGTSGSTSGLQCKEDWCGNELPNINQHVLIIDAPRSISLLHRPFIGEHISFSLTLHMSVWRWTIGTLCISRVPVPSLLRKNGYVSFRPDNPNLRSSGFTKWDLQNAAGTPLRLEACHEGNCPSAPLVLVCCPATASLVYCPASLCAKTLSSTPQAKRRDVSQVLKRCIGWLRLQSGSFKRDTFPREYQTLNRRHPATSPCIRSI